MLALNETTDTPSILSFIKGEGIRRRCMGGMEVNVDVDKLVQDKNNVFMLAYDNTKPVGFICLYPAGNGAYSIHLCLRTVGEKTKKLVKMAFNYAMHFLNATTIYAIYPKSARAVSALCRHFQFKHDPNLEASVKNSLPEPFEFERLDFSTL